MSGRMVDGAGRRAILGVAANPISVRRVRPLGVEAYGPKPLIDRPLGLLGFRPCAGALLQAHRCFRASFHVVHGTSLSVRPSDTPLTSRRPRGNWRNYSRVSQKCDTLRVWGTAHKKKAPDAF